MKFLGYHHINIININREYIYNNEDRYFIIPIYYRRPDSWVDSRNDIANPDLKIIVYNLTFEEFFNLDSIIDMMDEEPNNTILFFKSEEWSEIINNFYMNGLFISVGSINQRHIFNSLDYTFSILMTTLFGKNFTQNATNYMRFKKLKKDLFNPNFNYKCDESEIFRLFNLVFLKEKVNSFINITRNSFDCFNIISDWDKISP